MVTIEQTWRWFGPDDPVTLADIRQTGATGIVTALHHIRNGEIWTLEEISKRQRVIQEAQLEWSVVESLPVTEDIILGTDRAQEHIENYCQSMRNLAKCDIRTITYNFMPILDWTRTNLSSRMHDGSLGLRFDIIELAIFDVHILERSGAEGDYSEDVLIRAGELFKTLDQGSKEILVRNIIAGLPGAEEGFTLEDFRARLAMYHGVDHAQLRENLKAFLSSVVPVAKECEVNLALHPDDPPMNILGIPRIASTQEDFEWILNCAPSTNNGLCMV